MFDSTDIPAVVHKAHTHHTSPNLRIGTVGLLIAAFDSSDRLVQICGAFALALPVSGAPVVWYMHHEPGARARQIRRWQHRIERRSRGLDTRRIDEDVEAQSPVANTEENREGDKPIAMGNTALRHANSGTHGRVSFDPPVGDSMLEV